MTMDEKGDSPGPDFEEVSIVAQFLTLGMTMAGTVGAGVVLGIVVDSAAHSAPIGLLAGLFLGSVGAATALVALLRRWK